MICRGKVVQTCCNDKVLPGKKHILPSLPNPSKKAFTFFPISSDKIALSKKFVVEVISGQWSEASHYFIILSFIFLRLSVLSL